MSGHGADYDAEADDGTYMRDHRGQIVDPFADALNRAEEVRCECRCHANPHVKHFAPCCYPAAVASPIEGRDS